MELSPPPPSLLLRLVRLHRTSQQEGDHHPDGEDHQGGDDEGEGGGCPDPVDLRCGVDSLLV